ncbi:MAG: hypothetical protein HYZ65_03080 [Burkholderiales bacterium]|nr:hypothetical protein [Burkholderiales bacterium]
MNHNPQNRVLVGAILLVFGALALVDNLNIFNTRDIFQFWPTVFILVGALKMSKSGNSAGYLIGGGFIALGVLLTLHHMGIITFRVRDWWPLFLIAAGLFVILKDKVGGNMRSTLSDNQARQDSVCDVVAIMSGNKLQNTAQDFRGGEITAIMGGVDLDLRNASIQGEAVINVFAMWGGIDLKVPTDWTVLTQGVPVLGGIEDKSVPPVMSGKRLIVKGYAIMGGVEITN